MEYQTDDRDANNEKKKANGIDEEEKLCGSFQTTFSTRDSRAFQTPYVGTYDGEAILTENVCIKQLQLGDRVVDKRVASATKTSLMCFFS